ncbi:MAG: hypothetical protein CME64_16955 [Halobacteriovoraceae bacterium]|nr:hypothetical protein [Halobacteriovoraceae bacterium]|tara:strand:+ start:217128 stop:219128 length:2001 start_codon:yes stop_codon:yes gene_type:complete
MNFKSLPKDTYFYSLQDDDPELIICANAYFKTIRQHFEQAQESILICGWSFNMDIVMGEDGKTLKEVLFSLPETVKVKILIWDYPIFYVADRDPFIGLSIALQNKSNIHFERFDFHPLLSSMHSKMVVVDNKDLFVGGIDLDLERRDGEYNKSDDPVRVDKDGEVFKPFRDYAFHFKSQNTKKFSSFFDQLWESQAGQKSFLETNHSEGEGNVLFSRTIPKFKGNPQDRSSFKMHKWLIQNAQDYIYIENQYLTSEKIVELLVEVLKKENGPEVVIVVSYGKMPFIEKMSMGALLTDYVNTLLSNDPHNRLKIYTLFTGDDNEREYVKIHSKCIIADDRYLKIGSSNINNRSMEFDYELDALYVGEKVVEFKNRIFKTLLGYGEPIDIRKSIIKTFELAKEKHNKIVEVKDILHDKSIMVEYKDYLPLDKREMTFFERAGQMFITKKRFVMMNYKIVIGAAMLCLAVLGALYVNPGQVDSFVKAFLSTFNVESSLLLMGVFFLSYTALGPIFFPLNAYIFLCGAYLDLGHAFITAIAGALSVASISYWFGAFFGAEIKAESKIEKVKQLKRLLKRNSLLTLVFLRVVPVAPYPLVNMVCGKFRVGFAKYITGTFIGVLPGTTALIFFEKQLIELFQSPSLANIITIAIVVILFLFGMRFVRRRMSA